MCQQRHLSVLLLGIPQSNESSHTKENFKDSCIPVPAIEMHYTTLCNENMLMACYQGEGSSRRTPLWGSSPHCFWGFIRLTIIITTSFTIWVTSGKRQCVTRLISSPWDAMGGHMWGRRRHGRIHVVVPTIQMLCEHPTRQGYLGWIWPKCGSQWHNTPHHSVAQQGRATQAFTWARPPAPGHLWVPPEFCVI